MAKSMPRLETSRIRITLTIHGETHTLVRDYPKHHTSRTQLRKHLREMADQLDGHLSVGDKKPV